ncbi:hydrogenase 3 maturation endopeptidase HyCI [Candidatus Margulisiibacteriota bacterium]
MVSDLKNKLRGKILILGVGNVMKRDDGAGPAAIAGINNIESIDVGVVPENYTGKIKQIKPDTLVIVDAIDFKGKAGNIRVFEAKDMAIRDFSTHGISLITFVGFLKEDLPGLNVIIVGIQPKEVGFGEGLSPEVEKAVNELCMSFT